ncbi:SulP family inorganic anion transporter [Formosa sp. S-31]|uniref:SulP family inorganic anion transporter n=1 Tax=Formosa sp. S-31 TaxID=2790949 RepID=UPI003EBD0518
MRALFTHIKGDAFGGITAGIVALPLALAFGVSSGLGPSAGLYGAIFLSFFASLFGGTNTQISGPTAPMTAVSMVIIAGLITANDGDVNKALPLILSVFILAGLIQIGLGFLGLGVYIKYIPYPVVSGFMTAIGLIILITQILPVLGYYPKEDEAYVNQFKPYAEEAILEQILLEESGEGILVLEDFTETVKRAKNVTSEEILKQSKTLAGNKSSGVIGTLNVLPRAVKSISWLELSLALGTIIIIYGFKRITKAVPSTLVALMVMSGLAVFLGLDYRPIEQIPTGLPIPHLEVLTGFSIGHITPYIFTALTLALLGAIDSLLTSLVADNLTRTKHNPNKELVGQGIGNTLGGLFGGIPGAGATIRTVVNIKSGGKTRLSGMIAGLVLLLILLALGPIASKIPAAVLAGILVTVGIGVMDYKGLKAIPSLPKDITLGPVKLSSEVLIMFIVLLLSTFWNLVYAVGIGLIIASLLFMKRIGELTARRSTVKSLSQEKYWYDALNTQEKYKEDIFVKHINGPLFFGSTSDFQSLIKDIPERARVVVIRFGRMQYLDQSGLYALEDTLVDLEQRNKIVVFVGLLKQPKNMMKRSGLIPEIIPEELIFRDFKTCLFWINNNIKETN